MDDLKAKTNGCPFPVSLAAQSVDGKGAVQGVCQLPSPRGDAERGGAVGVTASQPVDGKGAEQGA